MTATGGHHPHISRGGRRVSHRSRRVATADLQLPALFRIGIRARQDLPLRNVITLSTGEPCRWTGRRLTPYTFPCLCRRVQLVCLLVEDTGRTGPDRGGDHRAIPVPASSQCQHATWRTRPASRPHRFAGWSADHASARRTMNQGEQRCQSAHINQSESRGCGNMDS